MSSVDTTVPTYEPESATTARRKIGETLSSLGIPQESPIASSFTTKLLTAFYGPADETGNYPYPDGQISGLHALKAVLEALPESPEPVSVMESGTSVIEKMHTCLVATVSQTIITNAESFPYCFYGTCLNQRRPAEYAAQLIAKMGLKERQHPVVTVLFDAVAEACDSIFPFGLTDFLNDLDLGDLSLNSATILALDVIAGALIGASASLEFRKYLKTKQAANTDD